MHEYGGYKNDQAERNGEDDKNDQVERNGEDDKNDEIQCGEIEHRDCLVDEGIFHHAPNLHKLKN